MQSPAGAIQTSCETISLSDARQSPASQASRRARAGGRGLFFRQDREREEREEKETAGERDAPWQSSRVAPRE
jgi:hypothetical protein